MKICFKHLVPVSASIILVALMITFTCCTKIDDSMGSEFIPEHQRTDLRLCTLTLNKGVEFDAYISCTDTVQTHNSRMGVMGKALNPSFGTIKGASVMQYMTTDSYKEIGHKPTLDSVKLTIHMKHMYGKKDVEQQFDVYPLIDSLRSDTTYFANFEYEKYIGDSPIFSFRYKGESEEGLADNIRVNLTEDGEKLAQEIIDDLKADTSLFRGKNFKKKYYGLAIVPSENSPLDAAMIYTDLEWTAWTIFYHDYKKDNENIVDKIHQAIALHMDDAQKYTSRNHSVSSIRRDFDGTEYSGIKNEYVEITNNTGYVQGIAGATTTIKLRDELFDAIEELKGDDEIQINQALLYIWVEDDEAEKFDAAYQRLGSYITYSTLTPIMDYAYTAELEGGNIAYSGFLNRTHGYYMMDISAYLTHSIKSESIRSFTLAPFYSNIPGPALLWRETCLKLSDDSPEKDKQPMIRLTYTVINKKS